MEGGEQEGDFATGEHVWQRFVAQHLDFAPDLPFFPEVVAVERSQGAEGLIDGCPGQLAVVLEMGEEIKDLSALKCGDVEIRVVVDELVDPPDVGFERACPQSF